MTFITLFSIICLFFLLITIHELGHFLAARCFHIKIEQVQIGYGHPLWCYHSPKTNTEYILGLWPLGGAVKLEENNGTNSFNYQPYWKRICVLLSGAVANLILACLLFTTMYLFGITHFKPIIGQIMPHSIASSANLHAYEQILEVDQWLTIGWQDVLLAMYRRVGETSTMHLQVLDEHQKIKQVMLDLHTWPQQSLKPGPIQSLGIKPYLPPVLPKALAIDDENIARRFGLQLDDTIIQINDKPIKDWQEVIDYFATQPPQDFLKLTLDRHGKIIQQTVHLNVLDILKWRFDPSNVMGIHVAKMHWPQATLHHLQYPLPTALLVSCKQTLYFIDFNYTILGKLLTGKLPFHSLGGPLSLLQSAYAALNEGFVLFIGFAGLLSISLAVVNLLPIPGLDGGHLVFLLIEKLRNRAVSTQIQLLAYRLGLIVILVIVAQMFANDLIK